MKLITAFIRTSVPRENQVFSFFVILLHYPLSAIVWFHTTMTYRTEENILITPT